MHTLLQSSLPPPPPYAVNNQPPPPYSPSLRHISICYLLDEGAELKTRKCKNFIPAIFVIESTMMSLYKITGTLGSCISYLFDELDPNDIDPEMNVKSTKDRSMFIRNDTHTKHTRISRLVTRFISRRHHDHQIGSEDINHNSPEFLTAIKLLAYQPHARNEFIEFSETEKQMEKLEHSSNHIGTWSLQELVKYGSACDFHSKPYALRMVFGSDQLLLVSYNPLSFIHSFYNLNIAHELSLDLELRTSVPVDYCTPRRHRHRRHSRSRPSFISASHISSSDHELLENGDVENCITIEENTRSRSGSNCTEGTSTSNLSDESSLFSTAMLREATSDTVQSHTSITVDLAIKPSYPGLEIEQRDPHKELAFSMRCIKNCRNFTHVFYYH